MSGQQHIGIKADASLAEAFEHRCELAGYTKSEVLRRFMEEFTTGGAEREKIEQTLEDVRAEVSELEMKKNEIESQIASKQSQVEMLEEKLDEIEERQNEEEQIIEDLAGVVADGGDVRGTPRFEELVELSDRAEDELLSEIESRSESVTETEELDEINVLDEYDI